MTNVPSDSDTGGLWSMFWETKPPLLEDVLILVCQDACISADAVSIINHAACINVGVSTASRLFS